MKNEKSEEMMFSLKDVVTSIQSPSYSDLYDIRLFVSLIFFSTIVAISISAMFKTSVPFMVPFGLVLGLCPIIMFKLRNRIAAVIVKKLK